MPTLAPEMINLKIAAKYWQDNPNAWKTFIIKDRKKAISEGKKPLPRPDNNY